jgi:hypothetical protein
MEVVRRHTGRRSWERLPLRLGVCNRAPGVEVVWRPDTTTRVRIRLRKNAAVERREVCALRHWARNASLRCSGVQRHCTPRCGVPHRRLSALPPPAFLPARFATRGGEALAVSLRRLFDIVNRQHVTGALQHATRAISRSPRRQYCATRRQSRQAPAGCNEEETGVPHLRCTAQKPTCRVR